MIREPRIDFEKNTSKFCFSEKSSFFPYLRKISMFSMTYFKALPYFVWQYYFHHLNGYGQIIIPILESKGETNKVEQPTYVKQLSLSQVCRIG
jgi:hypothetical protein